MIERAIAGLLVVASCAPDPPDAVEPPELEWEGQWLRFGRSAALAPQCAGVAPYMDRYVGTLVDLFEIEADVVVDFYYVDQLSSPCDALGCARDNAVYSLEPVQEHELVHAVRSYEGFSQLMLEEGAAELWGDDSTKYPFRTNATGDLLVTAELPSADGLPSEAYGISGRFHALLHERSPQGANALLRTTTPLMSRAALSEQMELATGSTLEQWATELAAYPSCDQREYRDATPACESVRTVAPCQDGVIDIEEYLACDDEEALGPRDGEIWKYVALEIDSPGTYSLFVEPDLEMAGGRVVLEECRGGCGSIVEEVEVPTSFTPARAFEAAAGTYLLRLTLPESAAGWFGVRLTGGCG